MPQITQDTLRQHTQILASLDSERSQWLPFWRDLSDLYLPQRYRWLLTQNQLSATRARRQYIINNTGVRSARILASGMMNGVTSPTRPWLKLRVQGVDMTAARDLSVWLEEVERRMLRILAESNFYNSMAVLFLDMVVFGSACNLIYEDRETVIRCYNPPVGEYYFGQSDRMQVNVIGRTFNLKTHQYIQRWPDRRYWSDRIKNAVEQSKSGQGAQLFQDIQINHLIAPNLNGLVPSKFPYYEMYWEARRNQAERGNTVDVLELHGFHELPGIFSRWEVSGTDAYGVSPAMDAYGDNMELQHLHKNKGELLEKTHKPPILADIILQNNPMGLMPNGVTFVPSLGTTEGAKPIYTVQPRFDQMNIDQMSIEQRIKDTFYNYLFNGISELSTVRSAAEIDAREGEKLIQLGGVLERLLSEGIDPGVVRVFNIANRANLFPPPPPQYQNLNIEVQYISTLSIAQRAVGTAPTERFLALVGNLAAIHPDALDVPDFDQLLINYARDIGVRESEVNSLDDIIQARQAKNAQTAGGAALEAGNSLSQSAKNLAATPVGGGGSALDRLLSGSFRPLG